MADYFWVWKNWYFCYTDWMRPLIITDFDGIINPMAQMPFERQWPDMTESFFIESAGQRNNVSYSQTVVDFYHEIVQQAEVIWLTSWVHDTEVFPQYLGLPQMPWIDDPWTPKDGPTVWWKLLAMKQVAQGRDVLWMDDEIPRDPESEEQQFIREHGNITVIIPETSKGLTPAHLQQIRDFISMHSN